MTGQIMNPSDTTPSEGNLNATSRALLGMKASVIAEWQRRISGTISEVSNLKASVVLDSISELFDNLAEALTPENPRDFATTGTNLGSAHGRERAKTTGYTPADLITELQIFRRVVLEVASEHNLKLNTNECNILTHSVEMAIVEAINAFTISHREIAETFIACLSHDLRNPLNVAKVSSQMIQHKSTDERVVSLAQRVCLKLSEMDQMIQSLLDASALNGRKKVTLHIITFDMVELVKEVCADLPYIQSPQIHEQGPVIGFWCKASMKRVLENLLSNAYKYGDKNRPVSVHIARVDDRLLLSVHNEGCPIPESEFERVFHSYHRLENIDIRGWGLGLPFVQIVVECHGGTVIVDSGEGRGTTFTISMPIDCRPYALALDKK